MWQCSSPGLADSEVPGGVTEVNIISPWVPEGLGLCTPGHQVINIFHLLERGGFLHLQNSSGNVHYYLGTSVAERQGNNGNSERLYFLGLQNHCRW